MKMHSLYAYYLQHPVVATDTRKIKQGDIFFALKGPNYNGNAFAKEALAKGASFIIVDEPTGIEDERIIQAGDSLLALQDFAKHHRGQFDIPVIAITGSNGKTTTKELVHSVLSSRYVTYTTEGNLNNHIGIPLTLLKIKPGAQMAVIEMGANNPGEIEGYCSYVKPTHGLITNFGKAHLEGFGGVEGVVKAKSELFAYLRNHRGTAFVNAFDARMMEMSAGINELVYFGQEAKSKNRMLANNSAYLSVSLTSGDTDMQINTKLVGAYNLNNVLAAVAVGRFFDIDDVLIQSAIEGYEPVNSRSQLIRNNSNTIVLDAYNANPSSMKAAIENFASMEGNNKIVMLGGMMELGAESQAEHEELVQLLQKFSWEKVVLVGSQFAKMVNNYTTFHNSMEARDWFKREHFNNKLVLIKGSRSLQMEKILE